MKNVARWLAVGWAVMLCGCATPEARIRKNPELFASFPPEIQHKIRQGKVDIGFTRDMVYMALGDPDRRYSRKTAEGEVEVWAYVDTLRTTERQRVNGPVRYRTPDGEFRTMRESMWVDVEQTREIERMRIEFRNGAVSAIEEARE